MSSSRHPHDKMPDFGVKTSYPLIRNRESFLLELAGRHQMVAHIGCTDSPYTTHRIQSGTLLHARLVKHARVVGIDIDVDALIELETLLPTCMFVQMDVSLEVRPEHVHRYDLVLAGEVLEHVPNPDAFLRGCGSLIAPGGQLCVTVPNACSPKIGVRALFGVEAVHPDHFTYYSPRTLDRTLRNAGFVPTFMGTYLAPPGRIGRIANRLLIANHALLGGPTGEGVLAIAIPSK